MEALKFDWKPSDYLNFSDLNRIEQWGEKLSKDLQNHGYDVKYSKRASPWTVRDIPSISDIYRIRRNIENLRAGYFAIPEWRSMVFDATYDFERQNAKEWDLQQCYIWYERMILIFPQLGVYQSNCVGYMPHELDISEAIPVPDTIKKHFVYNGSIQSPGLSGGDLYIITGTFEEEDAGKYSFEISPKPLYKWNTGDKRTIGYNWEIEKAQSVFETEKSIVLDGNKAIAVIPVKYVGDGNLKVSTFSGAFKVLDFSNSAIKIMAVEVGSGDIIIDIEKQKNYTTVPTQRIRVTVTEVIDVAPKAGVYTAGSYFYI